MNKYVFSFISFYDNILTSKIIESEFDEFNEAYNELSDKGYNPEDINSLDDLKDFAFNCDCMFEIIKVN